MCPVAGGNAGNEMPVAGRIKASAAALAAVFLSFVQGTKEKRDRWTERKTGQAGMDAHTHSLIHTRAHTLYQQQTEGTRRVCQQLPSFLQRLQMNEGCRFLFEHGPACTFSPRRLLSEGRSQDLAGGRAADPCASDFGRQADARESVR